MDLGGHGLLFRQQSTSSPVVTLTAHRQADSLDNSTQQRSLFWIAKEISIGRRRRIDCQLARPFLLLLGRRGWSCFLLLFSASCYWLIACVSTTYSGNITPRAMDIAHFNMVMAIKGWTTMADTAKLDNLLWAITYSSASQGHNCTPFDALVSCRSGLNVTCGNKKEVV